MRFFGIVICLVALVLTGYSAVTYQAPKIEADIHQRAEAAIAVATSRPIDVGVDGRTITLRGAVADGQEMDRLLKAARSISGSTGVNDALELVVSTSPYRFEAIKSADGSVSVKGLAPDDDTQQLLTADSHAVFGDDVEIKIDVAAGAPDGDWRGAVGIGLDALATMVDGRMTVVDHAITLEGNIDAATDSQAIDLFAEAAPTGFSWTNDLAINHPIVAPYTLTVQKNVDGGLTIKGHAPDQVTRAAMIDQTKAAAGDRPVVAEIQIADGMPDSDWPKLVSTGIAAMEQVKEGRFEVSDNDVSFSGDVAAGDDLETLREMTNSIPGSDEWIAGLAVDQGDADSEARKIQPYTMTIDKKDVGGWSIQGVVPNAETRDLLIDIVEDKAGPEGIDASLQHADGAPDDDWQQFVADRLAALDMVQSGRLSFDDHQAHLIGVVATLEDIAAVQAELAAIDSGMTSDLNPIDPRPVAKLDLTISPDDGVTLSGKLPEGLEENEAMAALGLQDYQGRLEGGARGDTQTWRENLVAIGSYLPQFERLGLTLEAGEAVVEGKLHGQGNVEQVVDGLSRALGERRPPAINVALSDATYANGARRTNPLNGREEEYDRGFWLPVIAFAPDLDECHERSSAILVSNKITFLRGEVALDARAEQVIDNLAAVAINCLDGGELVLEIGGHTDSRGAKDLNEGLSQARADLVLQSLIARGVNQASLIAAGYGDRKPIADNATDEGRAQNRRITFEWKKSWIEG